MPGRRGSVSDRFWSKVRIDRMDACWLWTGAIYEDGYGRLNIDGRAGGDVTSSRAAYFIATGVMPSSDEDVCHTCDNRACVNFQHLYLGTRLTNMRDAADRDRIAFGSRCKSAKLSEEKVLSILRDERSTSEIASAFGVHYRTIRDIQEAKTWVRVRRELES